MKLIWKEIMVCLMMGLLVPGAMLEVSSAVLQRRGDLPIPSAQTIAAVEPDPEPVSRTILVRREDGSTEQAELEDYLVGVVLAEMPASFETEALKAQAVAARTYAAKAHITGGKHGDGSICTDPHCCQAWLSEDSYLIQGGMPQAVDKVRKAVSDTAGQVITYGDQLIEATYFACSGGSTEDARAVWGSDFPYLRAVDSPGEENAETFLEAKGFSREKLELLLGITLPEDPARWLGEVKHTPGQGVETLEIGGKVFTGLQLRSLLDLRSTCFTATAGERGLVIETRGYGHRVGMSQYGADAMAASGSTYDRILGYYYQGTKLEDCGKYWELQEKSLAE